MELKEKLSLIRKVFGNRAIVKLQLLENKAIIIEAHHRGYDCGEEDFEEMPTTDIDKKLKKD